MGNLPIRKWRASGIEVAIWSNKLKKGDNEEIEYKTISLSRSYKKKGEDIWRSEVINLRKGDIPKVMVVLAKAQEELLLNDTRDKLNEEIDEIEDE